MTPDVVVVGAGVAGAASAIRLARASLAVTVLERETVCTDRVRGEGLVGWGLEQADAMGLREVVRCAPGASAITHLVNYDETVTPQQALARARDLRQALPGSPGILGVGHPELREALLAEAVAAGAVVVRGVQDVLVTPGAPPRVAWTQEGRRHQTACRLVLGADGKDSTVRRAVGIALTTTTPRILLSGMAVDDGGAWDRSVTAVGVEGPTLFYVIPRGGDRVRLYLGRRFDDPVRFTGPDRQQRFLEELHLPCLPGSDLLAGARPVGPCASFPMTDSWTSRPYVEGVVLLGDAAGWSNPVTGLGLAVALRDARVLTDLLLDGGTWGGAQLTAYAEERGTRMARLQFASAVTDVVTAFGAPDRAAKRERVLRLLATQPELGQALEAVHGGPWRPPERAFAPANLAALALA